VKRVEKQAKYVCIGMAVEVDLAKRKVFAYLIDGDQRTDCVTVRVPKKFPMPVPVDDYEFLQRFGKLPHASDRCHIRIGYDYAYDVRRYHG